MPAKQVDILIAIDTDRIFAEHPTLSQDPKNPTGIAHNSQYMLCRGARRIISGQGTADLSFEAHVGDEISFTATSLDANSCDSVIVYDIRYWKGDHVFNRFVQDLVIRNKAATPNHDTEQGIPAIQQKTAFSTFDTKVRGSGQQFFYVCIALYKLADDGHTQELKGFAYWDPVINVT